MATDPSSKPIQAVVRRCGGKVAKTLVTNLNPLEALREVVQYMTTVQKERTERQRIRAKRDCVVESLRAQRDLISRYFELRFGERRETLDRLFVLLDRGADEKNEQLLNTALTGILGVVKDNPLSDFEAFRTNMAKDGFELEL